jgi:hypothetical protein
MPVPRTFVPDGMPASFVQTSAPAASTSVSPNAGRNADREWLRGGADFLPAIGGTVGGLLAAPSAAISGPVGPMAGIYLGGATGENARLLAYKLLGLPTPEPLSWEMMNRLNQAGNEQLALEAGGRVMAGAARAVGKGLMRGALRPTPTLLREFPSVVETAIRERIPVGKSDVALERLRDSAMRMRAILEDAERRGVRFRPEDIAASLRELRSRLSGGGNPIESVKAVNREMDSFVNQWQAVLRGEAPPMGSVEGVGWLRSMSTPERVGARAAPLREVAPEPYVRRANVELGEFSGMTPNEVKNVAQIEQARGKNVFRAIARGNVVPEAQEFGANVSAGLGTGASEQLHMRIPGTAARDARTQELIGLTAAMAAREGRNMPILTEIGVPMASAWGAATMDELGGSAGARGLLGALMSRLAMDPAVTSRAALHLTNPTWQLIRAQTPRYLWPALKHLGTSGESDYGSR